MNIDHPKQTHIPHLRQLWKTAFDDDDTWLDQFFSIAFDPNRCLCAAEGDDVLAALYWFDVSCEDKPIAYIYAVATSPAARGRGLCRALITTVKALLAQHGYAGALLVPEDAGLAQMYERMGFAPCTTVSEQQCSAGPYPASIHKVDASEYARLRRERLPNGGVLQEGAMLDLLASQASFYAGQHCLAAISPAGEELHCHEFLGDPADAPEILRALGYGHGFFRFPGTGKPFASFCPLTGDCPIPAYFGLALD